MGLRLAWMASTTLVSALASRPQSLNLSAMSELTFDRLSAAVPLDRETLLARFDGIRQFARGGRRAPHKPLLLLYALARLKHDRQREITFNATEAIVNPLLRSYGPWGSGAHVSYPYGRLVNDGLWHLPDRAQLLDANGNVREGVARERDAPAGFTPDVLATFEREPELIDVVALHLLERHFAPGLHEEILEAVGLELGTPIATRRRDIAFRSAEVSLRRPSGANSLTVPEIGSRASRDFGVQCLGSGSPIVAPAVVPCRSVARYRPPLNLAQSRRALGEAQSRGYPRPPLAVHARLGYSPYADRGRRSGVGRNTKHREIT